MAKKQVSIYIGDETMEKILGGMLPNQSFNSRIQDLIELGMIGEYMDGKRKDIPLKTVIKQLVRAYDRENPNNPILKG